MGKTAVKRYFARSTRVDLIDKQTTYNKGGYLLSDAYSIVYLVNDAGLEETTPGMGANVQRLFDDFENMQLSDLAINVDIKNKEEFTLINDNYSIGMVLLKRIYNVIKFDKIEIVESIANWEVVPIIKATNTKTKERAYLLPVRRF